MLRVRLFHHIHALSVSTGHPHHKLSNFAGLASSGHKVFLCANSIHSMSSDPSAPIEDLQDKWNHLYRTRLPTLAKAKDPAQPKWPVQLDHCFARIVLDNAVGKDRPWAQVVKSPAYKNMSRQQLEDAIELGEKLASGEENLVELDEKSLALRGKKSKVKRQAQSASGKKTVARKDDKKKDENSKRKIDEDDDHGEQNAGKKRARKTVE